MIHLISLENYPIYKQLQLEEALLRTTDKSFCLINKGSPPAIVMGISGKKDLLVHKDNVLPVIKRFSGGGTVVVDDHTLFVSFIFQKDKHDFPCFPEPVYRWAEDFYKSALDHPEFALKQNDFVIGNTKCGGNAQYMRKNLWLHHTTFLWDYKQKHMNYLLNPKKAPEYRDARPHDDFLCTLKDHFPSREDFLLKVQKELAQRYEVKPITLDELEPSLALPHRKSTVLVD